MLVVLSVSMMRHISVFVDRVTIVLNASYIILKSIIVTNVYREVNVFKIIPMIIMIFVSLSIMSSRSSMSVRLSTIWIFFRFSTCLFINNSEVHLSLYYSCVIYPGLFKQPFMFCHLQTTSAAQVWYRNLFTPCHLSQSNRPLMFTSQIYPYYFCHILAHVVSTSILSLICANTIDLLADQLG
jgi:hypothetical protein